MQKKIRFLLLCGIMLAALFLRFYELGSNPPALTWDEAAWGYNAYSLGIDGKDEFGKFAPVNYIESFGDFKPPLYAYLSIVPVKIFGLNEFSTRFTSSFFGVLTVLLTYFLVKRLFEQEDKNAKNAETLALLSSFLLAISPWHILLSRAAFEANVASFFIVLGVLLFLIAVQKRAWLIILSVLSFVLSMYTFNTARIVSPLLVIGLTIFHWREILKIKKEFIAACLVGFVVFLPLFLFMLTPQAQLRFAEVNIFSDISVIERVNKEAQNADNSPLAKIIYNRRFAYAAEYFKHYFDNLNPQFLFIRGDGNPKFSMQDVGQIYLWETPFLIAGIFLLAKYNKKIFFFLLYWIIVAVAPAATARETPHALRIETVLPTFQIFTAFGILSFVMFIVNIKYKIADISIKYLIFFLCLIVIIFNFSYFLFNYFVHYPREFSGEWQYGYKDSMSFVKENENKFDTVYFTQNLGRPYIYFLFYQKYDPAQFRDNATVKREALGFVHVRSFDKYHFVKDLGTIKKTENALYIDTPGDVPAGANILKTFYLQNGSPVLVAYTL